MAAKVAYKITTDHPACSYGQPVLVRLDRPHEVASPCEAMLDLSPPEIRAINLPDGLYSDAIFVGPKVLVKRAAHGQPQDIRTVTWWDAIIRVRADLPYLDAVWVRYVDGHIDYVTMGSSPDNGAWCDAEIAKSRSLP